MRHIANDKTISSNLPNHNDETNSSKGRKEKERKAKVAYMGRLQ